MGRTPIYTQIEIEFIKTHTIDEICAWFPNKDRNTLLATKRYWSNQMAKNHEERPSYIDAFEQAVAAKITPTRRRRALRMSKLILVYGDGQVGFRRIINPRTQEQELMPLHNEAAHRIIQQLNAELQPETTVNLGDFADMTEFSRFDPDSDHFHKTLGPSMQYIHNFYAQMKADNPTGHHVEVDSNHAIRPRNKILKVMPELYDYYRPGEDYPMGTYYSLANLAILGIDFRSGYGQAVFSYGEEYNRPPVHFKHGNHSSSVAGATVRKEMAENPDINVVRGHGHTDEECARTMRDGWQLFYRQLGSSCLNMGPLPGFDNAVDDFNRPVAKTTKHQNSVFIMEDFQNGHYTSTRMDIVDGKGYYKDKEYDGNA